MAQIYDNIVVSGLRGKLGKQLIIKRGRHGQTTVVSRPQYPPNRQFSEAQKQHQLDFRQAAKYGMASQALEVYIKRAEGTRMTPYNAAMSDWFNPPEIREIDLDGWTGQIGKVIRILAVDDVQVKQVTVMITDVSGTVLEQGPATSLDGLWWEYTTTATGTGSLKVTASAQDLPGHVTQFTKLTTKT